jgi:hypothetical protein
LIDHLTPEELQAALSGELSRSRWQGVVRHLLRGCPECRTSMAAGLHPGAPSIAEVGAYDEVLDVSFERVLAGQRQRRAEDILPSVAIAEQVDGLRDQRGVIESLLHRSWALRFDNPRKMVGLARQALEVALSLDLG